MVAVRQDTASKFIPLWILAVESKNIEASKTVGVAQMLSYVYTSVEQQHSVWGLVTNGLNYRFFYIQNGDRLTYQYMPSLNVLDTESALRLLQVFKAIREGQPSQEMP